MNSGLSRYRTALLATMLISAIGVWPALIAPLGRVYVAFCARYLAHAPFGHHVPPLLMGFLLPITVALSTCLVVALAREALRQRRLARLLASRLDRGNAACRPVAERLGLARHVSWTSDAEVYAFCSGLITPRIYVSRGLVEILTPEELEAVLRHELHHLKHRDPLRYFTAGLVNRLSPVFPVLATATDRLRIRAELSADRAALTSVPTEALAAAMMKVMRAGSYAPAMPASAALSPTDARVAALTGRPVVLPVDWQGVAISVVVAVVLVGVAVSLGTQALPLPPACSSCPPF